jgi:hypothetical protein
MMLNLTKKAITLGVFRGLTVELALLTDKPRKATIRAKGRLKLASLGKKAFVRLLGPVVDIIKRNVANYQTVYQTIDAA